MVLGNMNGQIVEIIHVADHVGFSDVRGWVCVCFDFEQMTRRQHNVRWVPATTRFEWVREFTFA